MRRKILGVIAALAVSELSTFPPVHLFHSETAGSSFPGNSGGAIYAGAHVSGPDIDFTGAP